MKLLCPSSIALRWRLVVCLAGSMLASTLPAQEPQQDAQRDAAQQPAGSPPPQSQPQAQPSQARDATEEIDLNNIKRSFVVHLPQGYDSQQHYPVVILLHGRDQDASQMARLTHFNDFADHDGIIVIYPNAANGRWNIGGPPQSYRPGPYRRGPYGGYPPRRPPPERREGAGRFADLQFIHRVLDKVTAHYSADTRRIYAAGLGEGGFVALHMGCNMADRVAAVAAVGAAMPETLNCIPSRPVPVLLINGTDDPIVHYGGGRYREGLIHLLSAEDTAKEWARLNRCAEKPAESKLPPLQKGGKDTKVYLFDGCRENAQVVLDAVKDGGHTWPGGEQYMNEKEIGKTSNAINANETIWSFLLNRKIEGESGVEK